LLYLKHEIRYQTVLHETRGQTVFMAFMAELKFRNDELMRTTEGIIENHTVDIVEDVRDAHGPEYAFRIVNNILETQRALDLGAMHGNDVAIDALNTVNDAEHRLGNNLPEDNG